MFDLNLLPTFQMTFNHTYLLNNISSPVDSGMWGTLAAGASAFLDANLGQISANATSQVNLAISFCNLFKFDYKRAAHNNDLFKTYNDTFHERVSEFPATNSSRGRGGPPRGCMTSAGRVFANSTWQSERAQGKAALLSRPPCTERAFALAVKLQPVDDLVDHLALGAHREPDQVEFGADHRLTTSRLAASCVVLNMSSV